MKTKLLSLIISAILLMSMVPTVFADNSDFSLVVTPSVSQVKAGDDIEFSVAMKNADNIDGIQFRFNYNSNELKYISSSFSTEVSNVKNVGTLNSKTNYIGVLAALNEGLSGNVDICKLKFKANGNYSADNLAIYISVPKFYSGSIMVEPAFISSTYTVQSSQIKFSINTLIPSSSKANTIYVAGYGEGGELVSVNKAEANSSINDLEIVIGKANNISSYKIMLLSDKLVPICESIKGIIN